MDRNSILGFVLIAAILGVYTWYTMPSAEEQARMQFQQDSLAQVEIERQARDAEKAMRNKEAVATPTLQAQSTDSMVVANGDTLDTDSLRQVQQAQRFGIFTPASTGKAEEVVLENERLQVAISTYGARPSVIRLKEYQTHQKTPLYLADPDSGNYEFRFFLGNLDISTKDLHFSAQQRGTTGVVLTAATTDPGNTCGSPTNWTAPPISWTYVPNWWAWMERWTQGTPCSTGRSQGSATRNSAPASCRSAGCTTSTSTQTAIT